MNSMHEGGTAKEGPQKESGSDRVFLQNLLTRTSTGNTSFLPVMTVMYLRPCVSLQNVDFAKTPLPQDLSVTRLIHRSVCIYTFMVWYILRVSRFQSDICLPLEQNKFLYAAYNVPKSTHTFTSFLYNTLWRYAKV